MDFSKVIRKRRSIRKFRKDPIPDSACNRLREALSLAPSANNKQPCSFTFVKDQDLRARIVGKACHQEGFLDAPLIVVACCQRGADFDCAIAVDHLILAATNEGLGSCWVGWIERDAIREILGIPADIEIPVIVPIGYAAEIPDAQTRKPLRELIQEDVFKRP
ncbi:MAG: nitroreductase family protein [Spirochaetia bacterium]|jgi:nitroreductase